MKRGWLVGAALAGSVASGALVKKLWLAKYQEQAAVLAAAERKRDLLYTWLLLKERGITLAEYFLAQNIHTVAVLGMDRVGRRFVDELQGHDGLSVVYGVEAVHLGAVHETLTVYRLGDDPLPSADCVVVCDLENTPEKLEAARKEFCGVVLPLTQVMVWLLEQHQIEPRDGAIAGWPAEKKKG